MRMQVILDSSFARPGSAPIWDGKKVEFRDWTNVDLANARSADLWLTRLGPWRRARALLTLARALTLA